MEEVNSKNVPANLSGEDFGKTLDAKLLKQLQTSVAEQQKTMIAVFTFYLRNEAYYDINDKYSIFDM